MPPEYERAVGQFLDELKQEALIIPTTEPLAQSRTGTTAELAGNTVWEKSFEAPILHKFTDMQELLLLDPIHEVDETGWPNPSQRER